MSRLDWVVLEPFQMTNHFDYIPFECFLLMYGGFEVEKDFKDSHHAYVFQARTAKGYGEQPAIVPYAKPESSCTSEAAQT
jgi:hypothetical protein